MYGNNSFAGTNAELTLSTQQRRHLRSDLASVAARTRKLLPGEFAVGLELSPGPEGPRATVAVQPPVGSIVSAGYTPDDAADARIAEDERDDIAQGLAASAALQVKQAMSGGAAPTAQ
jgi:hypothetical protein